jgi:aryl-alcohol dehydrogenase-like predicted oxidoreductase
MVGKILPSQTLNHRTHISITSVIATASDLGVTVIAYAPLGRGFLTGKIKSRADLDPNDMRLHYERFSEDVRPYKPCPILTSFRPLTRLPDLEHKKEREDR